MITWQFDNSFTHSKLEITVLRRTRLGLLGAGLVTSTTVSLSVIEDSAPNVLEFEGLTSSTLTFYQSRDSEVKVGSLEVKFGNYDFEEFSSATI